MSYTSDLLQGLAQILVTAGVAVDRVDGSDYLTGETGIAYGTMPDEPDRMVVFTDYPVSDMVNQPYSTVGVQVRTRGLAGLPFDEQSLRDAVFLALQGVTQVVAGSCQIIQCLRHSAVPLGTDSQSRWVYSQNFYVDIATPTSAYRN